MNKQEMKTWQLVKDYKKLASENAGLRKEIERHKASHGIMEEHYKKEITVLNEKLELSTQAEEKWTRIANEWANERDVFKSRLDALDKLLRITRIHDNWDVIFKMQELESIGNDVPSIPVDTGNGGEVQIAEGHKFIRVSSHIQKGKRIRGYIRKSPKPDSGKEKA